MSRPNIDELARQTKTAAGTNRPGKRTDRRGFIRPVLEANRLYWATDVQDAFGVQPVTFADWKRQGLEVYFTPAGDLVTGEAVIEYLRKHRVKSTRSRVGV